ncbi:hypothetical protein C1878_07440 [Gordonibacter sp. 28C]|uniref:hypothetical protein n=1 Tax=Gordonibacter sp. 28C TaxID=2078569 RepID=UPI000DF74DC4|nr:hypothetical protein [Gordonibacter sp. 28C]RDB62848.1 hypothetical protein C1878_07440 [Gordonibacter sp. 28C]
MKKSNWIILAVLTVAAGFFLWLWYYLGFNFVDDPFDLVLAIVWWGVVAALVMGIHTAEKKRQQRVRTVYVSDGATFNSEKGLMRFEGTKPMQEVVASILENLKYDFTREDFPERDEFDAKFFIRTKEFDVEKADEAQAEEAPQPADSAEKPEPKKWTGEVVVVDTKEERPFETPEELATILASLDQKAA